MEGGTKTRQTQRSEATRAKLIEAGRELFAKRGYADVGTEEIVRQAKVTRGALYHHFDDKQDLFRAVFEAGEQRIVERTAAAISPGTEDPADALADAMRAFLDMCLEPDVARIALIEAPVVLGFQEWSATDEKYGLGLAVAVLEAAMDARSIRRQPVKPLAQVLLAALGGAGRLIAHSDDPKATRKEMERALMGILDGLRA
jgi:AcrR family transcriptional regulator